MTEARVLIVDDSALMRRLLVEVLSNEPGIEVVGVAADPYQARDQIKKLHPNVLTLDVEMPRMDGLTFLDHLMRLHPMPVLMVSSLTEKGCETTLRALELGAVDFVAKPKIDVERGTVDLAREIVSKVKAAAAARVCGSIRRPAAASSPKPRFGSSALIKSTHKVIAVGASTGGAQAIQAVLTELPADAPGMVIVQHMPQNFTRGFAERLNGLCRVEVREAVHGDSVRPGLALIAEGGRQMEVRRSGAEYRIRVSDGDRVNRHRPSVDVLFHSCAQYAGRNAIGVLLTGMGDDGARGLLAMRQAGARTIAQDEATCVVFGMPKEAIERGAAEKVAPLHRIPGLLLAGKE